MRLLRAELARMFARRFTKLMLLTLLLTLGVVAAVTASDTYQPTAAEVQRAEVEAAQAQAECRQHRENVPPESRMGSDEFSCDQIGPENFLPYVLDFRKEMPEMLAVLAGLLALFGFLVGASTVGVEWSSGGMTNLLLWRPRRGRVLIGKFSALVLGVFGVGVLIGTAWVGAIWLIARYLGSSDGLTRGFWISLGLDGARGMALALFVTLVGAAVASLGRRTAAALGVVIGYVVVWEIGARIVMENLWLPSDRFTLSSYTVALLNKRYEFYECETLADNCTPFVIGWSWGLAVTGAVAVLAMAAAIWSIRRRDVA